jgi:uncharacterized membrane protein
MNDGPRASRSVPAGPVADDQRSDSRVRRVELLISAILRVGVVTSLSVVVFGTVISFLHHPDYTSVPAELQRLTSPGAAFPRTLGEVWGGVRHGRGQAVVVVGLLLLIATPVIRVAVSVFTFVYQRDATFVAVTSLVLALLLLSFALGKAGG